MIKQICSEKMKSKLNILLITKLFSFFEMLKTLKITLPYICYTIFVTLCLLCYVCYTIFVMLYLLRYVCYTMFVTLCLLCYICYAIFVTLCLLRYICYAMFVTLYLSTLYTIFFESNPFLSISLCWETYFCRHNYRFRFCF